MKIEGAVVFITGANRASSSSRSGSGERARKVYAAARDPATVTLPGVVPVKLDVTDPAAVAAAADAARDVTLLINNAGIARLGSLTDDARPTRCAITSKPTCSGCWRCRARSRASSPGMAAARS